MIDCGKVMRKWLGRLYHLLWRAKEERDIAALRREVRKRFALRGEFPDILARGESWKLRKLMDCPGARFHETKDGIAYSVSGKSLLLTDWNDIFIAADSFVNFDYGFALPGGEAVYVVDVGANIGDTAIVFASLPHVERVFAFEPLGSIYRRQLKNYEHNPGIAHKIRPFPFGLGRRDETLSVTYPENSAYCATASECWHGDSINTVTEDMAIKEAGPVLREILEEIPGTARLVLKLDCEGAEFDLLPSLREQGILQRFSLVMMEFHRTDPAPLVAALSSVGFVSFWAGSLDGVTGRLYAHNATGADI